ncbi:hypothetical protein YPPY36_1152 [Yersinia pestis PY-36]|nr:hypothetical protein YPPY03_1007 [Yersinia pestis PY-03]EIR07923.1 hypothetical protein YPPY05_0970 [Yersinia pestis PY-05]EIR82409.1 hypothetical protein YPPY32_1215 [Yersinia pestis PY-32]EIR93908.1 hypothetical protein YPPY36_1152 [Yersinia pestis PY-36]EIS22011.1 hypothetical protein YPPY52_0988 [Yersinia pestis PY-52]EIS82402.1 hypothetical protein YPPY72_1070 [Yersinia pestis PY-72]EIS91115.1 hypothetical protein YPPY76_0904 [Yersinia pestis PY-76]EIS96750.1 hypothetical protein YPP
MRLVSDMLLLQREIENFCFKESSGMTSETVSLLAVRFLFEN